MSLATKIDNAGDPSIEAFEAQARELSSVSADILRLRLLEMINAIDQATHLREREKSRRILFLLGQVALSREDFLSLASLTATLRPSSKNAILSLLPQDLRPTVYRAKASSSNSPSATQQIPVAEFVTAVDTRVTDSPSYAVVLIGTENEHEANIALLRRNDITPLRSDVPSKFEEIARSEVAGIVIGGTVWKSLSSAEHEGFIRKLLGFSSVLYLRIDLDGLDEKTAAGLLSLREQICFKQADAAIFCYGTGCRLSPTDIASIKSIAGLLSVSSFTRFHPREIKPNESVLVRVVANKHARSQRLDQDIRLEQIQTSFFTAGRSTAKVLLVRPDDSEHGFVLKVDKPDSLTEEMKKYFKYISRWEGKAVPEIHFHGQAGAILFSLVDSPDSPGSPAPTLDEEIERAMNGELGSWGATPPKEEDLELAADRVIKKLVLLNIQRSNEKGYGYAWISKAVSSLSRKGIDWQIFDRGGERLDLSEVVENAAVVIAEHQSLAVAHGDIHLHNILLRDRDPFFIDYGLSGPGHPCYDLVRFESAVTFKCFRALAPEDRVTKFFEAIYIDGASLDKLKDQFPELLKSIGNRLSAKICIEVRKQCMDLTRSFNADIEGYLAMKLLVSASALTMLQPQSAICRASIAAVGNHIKRKAI